MSTPTIDQLKHAVAISEQIQKLQADLAALFNGSIKVTAVPNAVSKPPASKGGMSAEGRARIIAAQKARWAKIRAEKSATVPAKAAPGRKVKKSGMSAEGRARIIAAQKARWAKIRGEKVAAPAPAKAASAPKKKKGAISAEGLARIKAAQKARWAKFRRARA